MKLIKTHFIFFVLFITMPCFLYSQTDELDCLRAFNLLVYKNLSTLNTNNIDVSSKNIKIVFGLNVTECGKIDSIVIRKSNLNNFAISETALTSSIIGKKIPCLRDVYYYIKEIPPDMIGVIYNTKFLEDK